MNLKARLTGALGVITLVLMAVVGTFYWSARGSEAALSSVLADRVSPLADLKIVADSYAVQIVDSAHKARNGNISFEQAAANVRTGRRDADAAWKRYRATKIEGEERELAQAAEATIAHARGKVEILDRILRSGDRPALDRFVVRDLYAAIDPVSDAIGKLVSLQIRVASAVTTDALDDARLALKSVFGLALVAFLVLAASLFVVIRQVVRPIAALTDTMKLLASGRYDTEVPGNARRDEVGAMAKAVQVFRENGIAKNAADAAKARADAEQELVVNALSGQLSKLSDGDLTAQIRVDFPNEYAGLKTNFNEALAKLRELIGAVSESAVAIRTGSGEIAQASEDLARRTESNAASLEETAASVAQMDGRLRASAAAASQTVERADQAISTVGSGRAVADEAVQAMGRVSESAKGIDSVIEGLDKIAFQTRVLAMNAAVEAGRAGDAGRGFAVVADLVSALAMRAEEEAKRARDQLTVTQTDIVTAVEAVQKVDGALADISGDVGQVHELLATMAADNQAQAAAITQISSAIGTMDHATQQNAAMVEETSAAARNLAGEISGLTEQAGRFTVNEGSPAAAAPRVGSASFEGPTRPLPAAAIPAMIRAALPVPAP